MSFIEVNNLKYRYPHSRKLALDGLNFSVEKGQFIGISGENKSGKSTFCEAVAGLVPAMFKGAYGGSVIVNNITVDKTPVSRMCQTVGLVFQNPFNQLSGARDTVFEEVAFGLQNLGVERQEIIKRVNETLELLDIGSYRDRNPFDLSGGQTQRVAIASILAMHPEVIVLDEPTSQLDPQGSDEVFRVMDTLKKTGITVLIAEHKIEKLAAYCDRILLLHNGKQIDFDTPERVFSRDDLESFGVEAPVYTKVCRKLGITMQDKRFPVTLTQAMQAAKDSGLSLRIRSSGAAPAAGEIFRMEELSFSYLSGMPVIKGLNLSLDARPTAVIGQNGAGKTTLVRLLKGLLKPVSGKIFYGDKDLSGSTVAMLAGDIGYVFQNPDDQIFKNKVLDEVMAGPLNIGMDKETAKAHSLDALKLVGLEQAVSENPYDLELSERKFLAIASVLAMDTDVIILDEPTIAQDARGRNLLGSLVKKLSGQGKFMMAILHDMDFVAGYFDRVIVMSGGAVLADGNTREVFCQKDVLKEARLEQPHITEFLQQLGLEQVCLTEEELIF